MRHLRLAGGANVVGSPVHRGESSDICLIDYAHCPHGDTCWIVDFSSGCESSDSCFIDTT